nr:hypothetical protein [Tanacetum cinerariifolium]
ECKDMPGGIRGTVTWDVRRDVWNCSGEVKVYKKAWGRKGNSGGFLAGNYGIRQLGWSGSLGIGQE